MSTPAPFQPRKAPDGWIYTKIRGRRYRYRGAIGASAENPDEVEAHGAEGFTHCPNIGVRQAIAAEMARAKK